MNRRVVVTGMGVVSSIGIGVKPFWQNLIKGKSGISKVTLFDTLHYKRHYAGEIRKFTSSKYVAHNAQKFFGRASLFAIAAIKMALAEANLSLKEIKTKKTAVVMGETLPEGNAIDITSHNFVSRMSKHIEIQPLLSIYSPSVCRDIGYYYDTDSINCLMPNACAAGNYSIGYSYDIIRNGEADIAITGGVEALSRIAFQGFQTMNAMAPKTCSPFDKERKGMMLGEGAGILILETLEAAIKRSAHIYAEVLGYGASCDARHMTIPDKTGVLKSMGKALKNAGVAPSQVDYISAHGTGTIANDRNETAAIKELLGEYARHTPVSSIKSMLGHCMGAASSIEAIACCLAIENGMIPPTINYKVADPECEIDCVPNRARVHAVKIALNNGFAFGGNNCCLVFGKLKH